MGDFEPSRFAPYVRGRGIDAVAATQAAALKGGDKTAPASGPATKPPIRADVLDLGPQHGMGPESPRAQTYGAANTYTRGNDLFLEHEHAAPLVRPPQHRRGGGLVLLRDCHGGLQNPKRLCEVAAHENVACSAGPALTPTAACTTRATRPTAWKGTSSGMAICRPSNAAGRGKLPITLVLHAARTRSLPPIHSGGSSKPPLGGVQSKRAIAACASASYAASGENTRRMRSPGKTWP